MDYEKKYNEALERARYVLHTVETAGCAMHKDLLTEIFPELRESEDERIRKGLIKLVKDTLPIATGTDRDVLLAWLEKQKEQKPQGVYVDCTEHPEWYGMPAKEQKPAEWDELQAEFRNINEAFEDGKKEVVAHPEKYGLCKPAEWSEEDERTIDRVCVALRAYANGELPDILPSEILEYADKLQSLHPQPHWKPSEVCYGVKGDPDPAGVWKPSEEQMEALEYVIRDYREDGCNATANYLQEILNHLKNM